MVYSAAGNDAGRQALNHLEQLRYTLGQLLGVQELQSAWPIRLFLFESPGAARTYGAGGFRLTRGGWAGHIGKGEPIPSASVTRILLDANTAQMPEEIERGLVAVFSTFEADNTIVTLGLAPPPNQRTRDWARMHLLAVSPEYASRARVLFSNLQQFPDYLAAYRNAFQKSPDEIEQLVDAYVAAADFRPRQFGGATINPDRDFYPRRVDPPAIETALADLLEGPAAAAAYERVVAAHGPYADALEGLGRYAEAVEAGSKSARCYVEYARRVDQPAEAARAYSRAIQLNPRWSGPYVAMAETALNSAVKAQRLAKAVELEPRRTDLWRELAETHESLKDFDAAAKAWAGAVRSAATEEQRESLRQARLAVEQRRADHAAGQRRQEVEARARELQRLKDEMMASIQAAERLANADDPAAPEGRTVVEWWDDPRPKQRLEGVLGRVDCPRGVLVLVLTLPDGGSARLVARDPRQIVILGGGEKTLACGAQDPAPKVAIEYFEQTDAALQSAGDVAAIEFR